MPPETMTTGSQDVEEMSGDVGVEVVGVPRKKKGQPSSRTQQLDYPLLPHMYTEEEQAIEVSLEIVQHAPSKTRKSPRVRHPVGTVLAAVTTTMPPQPAPRQRDDPTENVIHIDGDPVPSSFRVVGLSPTPGSPQQQLLPSPKRLFFVGRSHGPPSRNLPKPMPNRPQTQALVQSSPEKRLHPSKPKVRIIEKDDESLNLIKPQTPVQTPALDLTHKRQVTVSEAEEEQQEPTEVFQDEPTDAVDVHTTAASIHSHQSKTTTKDYLLLAQQLMQKRKEEMRRGHELLQQKQRKATNNIPAWKQKCGGWRFVLVLSSVLLIIIVGFLVITTVMTSGHKETQESAILQTDDSDQPVVDETPTIPPMPPIEDVLSPPDPVQTISPDEVIVDNSFNPAAGTVNNPLLPQDFPKTTEVILNSNDPNAPQVKAYQWLLSDPTVSEYPSWRQYQRMALATLYYSTNGPEWRNADAWLRYDENECQWYANACDSTGIIRRLLLSESNLDGVLPPELFWLTKLQQIQLFDNPLLRGNLPTEIGFLTDLQVLWIHRCGFTAPTNSPALPSEIAGLSNSLLYLDLSWNSFGRSASSLSPIDDLPTQLGRLTQLREFQCASSGLSGRIPSELGALSGLEVLDAHENEFVGTLASEMGLLTQLESLDISANHLGGTLPPEFGSLTKLQTLWLFDNLLSGPAFPPEWRYLSSSLTSLDLSMNKLDSLSYEIGQLGALKGLWLYSNNIRGTIPRSLGNLSNLIQMSLFGNLLSGQIPDLSSGLRGLWLDSNQLTGPIPNELITSTRLISLHLFDNRLQGPLPEFPPKPTYAIEEMYLQQNLLTSTIPPSIGNLVNLEVLKLHQNKLSGTIPSNIALLPLLDLTLHQNELTGTVPWELCGAKISSEEFMDIAIDCNEVSCQCGCTCSS